jgi:hypothetical protein
MKRCLLLAIVLFMCALPTLADKPRLLVLTDIGGDPDDQQSMIRLMVYANELEIEGLIASASGTPGELKEKVTKPHLIREIVEAYSHVHGNLSRYADGYPTAQTLLARIKTGNPHRGRKAIGEGQDTEGSRWIIEVASRIDARPLNISIWGGQTDLAQALWRVREERGLDGLKSFIAKLRIYDIADQDGIADWLNQEFSGLFYILAQAPPGADKREGVFRGMYLGGDESLTSLAWVNDNVRQNHGPLGALYPVKTWTAPNPHGVLKEGDTPSWFYFLPNGLIDSAHPEWGGWGGRFQRESGTLFRDARDEIAGGSDARRTVWRWRSDFQNDFAARMDWCVAGKQANRQPLAVLNGDITKEVILIAAKPEQKVTLSAEGSKDADGDAVDASWFVYPEAGTFKGAINLRRLQGTTTAFVAPPVESPATIHVILRVQDKGAPPLVSYRRAVVTVNPR